jgi:hypothetical protein
VVANCDRLSNLKFSPNLPYAFTEHSAIMAANLLRSERAVKASVFVVRAFVKLREMLSDVRASRPSKAADWISHGSETEEVYNIMKSS